MRIPRRIFLKQGGIALAALGASSLWGPDCLRQMALAADARRQVVSGSGQKVFICIFQRGAADGLSMVVPHGDADYYVHRQEIALARPSSAAGPAGAIDLDGFFGLHPALDAFMPIFKSGHLAAIHACGSPNASRSHFDSQDLMESGVDQDKSVSTGWLNRTLLNCPQDRQARTTSSGQARSTGSGQAGANARAASPFRAVAMTSVVPRTLQGEVDAMAIHDLSTFGISGSQGASGATASGFEGMYENAVGDALHGTGKESFEAISMLKKADPARYEPAGGVEYPKGMFGRQLMQVAQLVKADLGMEVAFVEMDGWDTHANQGAASGQLAGRLHDFSRGIAALYNDLGDRMADVVILTMSEFGRAARQNGNRGTDHGHATCFFALGGNINGGKVLGQWPGLAPEKLFEDRDLAVTTDFRNVLGEICSSHFQLDDPALARVFPHYSIDPKNFRGVCRA
jgi:uncharacterized protein (DUF1501 family)